MRRVPLTLLFVLLALPASAFGDAAAVGDGSLAVTGANAKTIIVQGHGLIYGHIDQGALTVYDFTADATNQFHISGSTTSKLRPKSLRYTGTNIRFLISGTNYTIGFEGSGINVSAVGKGVVTALGAPTTADSQPASDVVAAKTADTVTSLPPAPTVTTPVGATTTTSDTAKTGTPAPAPTPDGVLAVNGGKAQALGKTEIIAQFGTIKPVAPGP